MRSVKYLLVGGGLSAMRAGQRIRALDPEGTILMVCQEPLLPYDRPPLSKEYLAGNKQLSDIMLESAETLATLKIEYILAQHVTALDIAHKTATLDNGEKIGFEKALLATGGHPVHLNIPGSTRTGVHYLRTAADADKLNAALPPGRKAVVIGGGFIGLEVAATLCSRGVEVTVIEAQSRIWSRFGNEELSTFITGYCADRGIKFLTGTQVKEFQGDGRINAVVTDTGDVLDCDAVCVGIGIRPNTELAAAAGLEVNDGIVVDTHMRTSHPDIYAAGDVINYHDPIFDRRLRAEHWGHAEHSGQVAGQNMAGSADHYSLLAYVWSDIFDIHLEFAGDKHGADAQLRRGSLTDNAFMILYLKNGKVTAYFAINTPAREYSVIRRMIQKQTDIAGREDQLADPDVSLRSLL